MRLLMEQEHTSLRMAWTIHDGWNEIGWYGDDGGWFYWITQVGMEVNYYKYFTVIEVDVGTFVDEDIERLRFELEWQEAVGGGAYETVGTYDLWVTLHECW